MNKVLPFLAGCFIMQQVCGNYIVAIDVRTEEIYTCHAITLECNQINFLDLMVIRETNSCGQQKQIDPISGRRC